MPRVLVGVLALLCVLAGCGGDPVADPAPTPSAPTAPTSTAPTPPVMPEAAKASTAAGAVAFIRYYVELMNHLEATGDEAPLLAVSKPSCRSCAAVVRAANAIYDRGGHVEGGVWTVNHAAVTLPAAGTWTVRIVGRLGKSKVIETGSDSPKLGSGGTGNAQFILVFEHGWEVAQWETT
jgi:hypothetical protein